MSFMDSAENKWVVPQQGWTKRGTIKDCQNEEAIYAIYKYRSLNNAKLRQNTSYASSILPRDAMLARYMLSSCVCLCWCVQHTTLYQNS